MAMTPVGSTSQWVASNRALETECANPLYKDPFARELAGDAGFAMEAALRPAGSPNTPGPEPYLSIRTRFLDDTMLEAVRSSSITQAVILAAGMDARAFRLEWPRDFVLYEVDRDEVFDRKEPVLERLHAKPTCDRRIVRVDLSTPWAGALVSAGFDPTRPVAILVEGLLMYLDEPSVTSIFLQVAQIACEGSWLGMDLISTDMLVSPYIAAYLKKLESFGCPWTFGVDEPEQFLAGQGWHGRVVMPGEPEANYGRWPYPVMPRTVRGLPRSYFVHARRMSAEQMTAHDDAARVLARGRQTIREAGVFGVFGCPDGDGPFPGVLALGGSDGGVPNLYIDLLVPEGLACLALGYFGTLDTQPTLVEVPLERIERGLRWLLAHPKVRTFDGRIALLGASKGGELALLVAATFPDLVGPVVAYTPSSVVWAGIDFSAQGGALRSSWSVAGRPLPFVPYAPGVGPSVSDRGMSVLPIYDKGLDDVAAVAAAAIPVECATGPLLLISGGDDRMWPAARMCEMVVERMRRHGRAADVSHLMFADAGHVLFPYPSASLDSIPSSMRFDLGGSREATMAAHASAWGRVIAHLEGSKL